MSTYTPAEKALAALWWDYARNPDFNAWLSQWMPAHHQALRNVLEVDHVRVGQPTDQPESIATGLYNNRPTNNSRRRLAHEGAFRQNPADTANLVEEILAVLPTAYKASDQWRGFSYTSLGFRDWHLTSHTAQLGPIYRQANILLQKGVLDWFYGVEAHGQHNHIHALLSFRHGHPQDWLRRTFNLPDDAKLAPTHSSYERAQEYLDNQATRVVELGTKPKRPIYVDGNRVDISRQEALEAISQGEPTYLLQVPPLDRPLRRDETRAINMWMQQSQAQPRVEERILAPDNRSAWDTAWEYANAYTRRIFEADLKQTIGGALFLSRPQGWFGQEVVLLRNIPQQLLMQQLSASWLKAVPVVVYTVDTNPNFRPTVIQKPLEERPAPPLIPVPTRPKTRDTAPVTKSGSDAVLDWWERHKREQPDLAVPKAQESEGELVEWSDLTYEDLQREQEQEQDVRRDTRSTGDPDNQDLFI